MNLNVAIAQMEIWDGEKEKNLSNALTILNSLSKSESYPDIVCFPELFTTGYDLKNVKNYAETIPGKTIEELTKISKGKFIVIGTILEVENDNYYNSAFIINKKGSLIGKYRKTHLFAPLLETDFLTPGNKISTFTLPESNNLKIGVAICYDLRFPEIFRKMALLGAQIIFVPSEFPSPKKKIWKTLLHARAIENQIYVIGINRIGKGTSGEYFGYSLVSNGEYLEHLGNIPETRVFSIDLNSLGPIRKGLELLKDRRTDLYNI
ncbi:MAG: nitrilase-related carbon-nitrogen hydrolase [Candidatus Thorarchaeota archaeon]